jgi:hypothetical protein
MLVDVHTRTELPKRAKVAMERLVSIFVSTEDPTRFKSYVTMVTRILRLVLYRLAAKESDKTSVLGYSSNMVLELLSARNNWIEFVTN